MIRFLSFFAVSGAAIPLIFQMIWWIMGTYQEFSLSAKLNVENLMLILWPSSLLLLPAGSEDSFFLIPFLTAIVLNVLLYVLVGVSFWYALKKSYLFLIPIAGALGFIWWRILTL